MAHLNIWDFVSIYANGDRHVSYPLASVLFAILALTSMVGCGGGAGGASGAQSANAGGFDNQTKGLVTDARLLELWHNAQTRLATAPISLNPVTVLLNGEANRTVAPDARAYQVSPASCM